LPKLNIFLKKYTKTDKEELFVILKKKKDTKKKKQRRKKNYENRKQIKKIYFFKLSGKIT
jgi:hypothetical protein